MEDAEEEVEGEEAERDIEMDTIAMVAVEAAEGTIETVVGMADTTAVIVVKVEEVAVATTTEAAAEASNTGVTEAATIAVVPGETAEVMMAGKIAK